MSTCSVWPEGLAESSCILNVFASRGNRFRRRLKDLETKAWFVLMAPSGGGMSQQILRCFELDQISQDVTCSRSQYQPSCCWISIWGDGYSKNKNPLPNALHRLLFVFRRSKAFLSGLKGTPWLQIWPWPLLHGVTHPFLCHVVHLSPPCGVLWGGNARNHVCFKSNRSVVQNFF